MTTGLEFASEPWAEACLDDALARIDQAVTAPSFGLEEAEDDGQPFFDGLWAQARGEIRVETKHGAQLVATTTIGLGGDAVTLVAITTAPELLDHHRQTVAEALELRRVRLRIVLTTAELAMKIAILSGIGNPLLAIRTAWRFLRDVRDQWQQRGDT